MELSTESTLVPTVFPAGAFMIISGKDENNFKETLEAFGLTGCKIGDKYALQVSRLSDKDLDLKFIKL